jgi:hypothetical protein
MSEIDSPSKGKLTRFGLLLGAAVLTYVAAVIVFIIVY